MKEETVERRDALRTLGSVSALAIGGIGAEDANAKASKPQAKISDLTTTALSKAWASYHATLDEMRALVEATSVYQKYPKARAKAYHVLMAMQAMTYNFAIAPRMSHPRIYRNCGWQTDQYSVGQNGPDFRYGLAFVDGRQSYRLHGRMGDQPLVLCEVVNGLFGGDGVKPLANYDWNDFAIAPDGSYEVVVSANPQPGNWIRIDPEARYQLLFMRRTLSNWHGDPGEMKIDRIGELPEGYYDADEFDEAAMAIRIKRAEDFFRFLTTYFAIGLWDTYFKGAGNQTNKLTLFGGASDKAIKAGSPSSNYALGLFELKDDEALIIEMDTVPDGAYWSFQLADAWSYTLPYHTRHTSLNDVQVARDSDGKLRVVICKRDPGIRNWLDTCGRDAGEIAFRNYRAKNSPVPKTSKVKVAELDALFPKDVARVTPQQRKEIIEDRRQAQLRWYGE
jgi:hypothetical protein